MIGDALGPQCSRAGCRAPADWELRWRNPRLHAPERVKVWLACAEHLDHLAAYLRDRDFPLEVVAFADDRVAP